MTTTDPALQSITDCMHLALRYPTRKKLPVELIFKERLSMLNDARVSEVGGRLVKFKANGGLNADGTVTF